MWINLLDPPGALGALIGARCWGVREPQTPLGTVGAYVYWGPLGPAEVFGVGSVSCGGGTDQPNDWRTFHKGLQAYVKFAFGVYRIQSLLAWGCKAASIHRMYFYFRVRKPRTKQYLVGLVGNLQSSRGLRGCGKLKSSPFWHLSSSFKPACNHQ